MKETAMVSEDRQIAVNMARLLLVGFGVVIALVIVSSLMS